MRGLSGRASDRLPGLSATPATAPIRVAGVAEQGASVQGRWRSRQPPRPPRPGPVGRAQAHRPHGHHAQQAGRIRGSLWVSRVAGCPLQHTVDRAGGNASGGTRSRLLAPDLARASPAAHPTTALDRRHPERAAMRPADADGFRLGLGGHRAAMGRHRGPRPPSPDRTCYTLRRPRAGPSRCCSAPCSSPTAGSRRALPGRRPHHPLGLPWDDPDETRPLPPASPATATPGPRSRPCSRCGGTGWAARAYTVFWPSCRMSCSTSTAWPVLPTAAVPQLPRSPPLHVLHEESGSTASSPPPWTPCNRASDGLLLQLTVFDRSPALLALAEVPGVSGGPPGEAPRTSAGRRGRRRRWPPGRGRRGGTGGPGSQGACLPRP